MTWFQWPYDLFVITTNNKPNDDKQDYWQPWSRKSKKIDVVGNVASMFQIPQIEKCLVSFPQFIFLSPVFFFINNRNCKIFLLWGAIFFFFQTIDLREAAGTNQKCTSVQIVFFIRFFPNFYFVLRSYLRAICLNWGKSKKDTSNWYEKAQFLSKFEDSIVLVAKVTFFGWSLKEKVVF